MKTMTDIWKELVARWQNHMPAFFRRMMWICGLISGTALAANEAMTVAGVQPHEWWTDILPYVIGVPAGVMFACKFTQTYGKDGQPIRKGLEPTQPSAVNQSDVETASPDAPEPADIEPYNEHID